MVEQLEIDGRRQLRENADVDPTRATVAPIGALVPTRTLRATLRSDAGGCFGL
jgi:hypothetical protein